MDLSSLFSISDNLYKFLFVGGIVMVIFSVTYPMQKKQLIDIEVNTYNQQVTLLNKDISALHKEIRIFDKEIKEVNGEKKVSNKKTKKLKSIDTSAKSKLLLLDKKVEEVTTKSIILKFDLERVNILKKHIATYDNYTCWLTWIGVVIGFSGLIMWSVSTYNTERLKIKEINSP